MADSPNAAGEPVPVQHAHVLTRRARLRVAETMERAALVELAERMASVAGVARVLARPATGSLIVETDRPAAEVLDAMDAARLIRPVPVLHRPPVRQSVQLGLARVDSGLRHGTDSALDFRTTLGLVMMAGAIVQILRGRIAGPATTMALAALSLLDNGKPKD